MQIPLTVTAERHLEAMGPGDDPARHLSASVNIMGVPHYLELFEVERAHALHDWHAVDPACQAKIDGLNLIDDGTEEFNVVTINGRNYLAVLTPYRS